MSTPSESNEWVRSLAGPLLLIPSELFSAWHGIDETESDTQVDGRWEGPDSPPTDYDRACDVQGSVALIDVADGDAVVLCSEQGCQAALHQVSEDQAIIVQQPVSSPSSNSSSWESVSREAFGPPEFFFDLRSGSLVLSDPGNDGEEVAEGIGTPIQEANLAPGRYSLATVDLDGPPDAVIVLHWLQREGDIGQITLAESKSLPHVLAQTATAKPNDLLFRVFVNGKTGFINQEGELVIAPRFHTTGDFAEGLAAVQIKGNYGYINHLGEITIQPQFELAGTFCDGLAPVKSDDEWVYIDRTGRRLLPGGNVPQSSSKTRARVVVEGKWGYADGQGKIVIPCEFDSATFFLDGLAQVSRGKRSWFIDKQGVIQFEIDKGMDVGSFSEGLCPFWFNRRKNRSGGYIDRDGKIILGPNDEWFFPGNFSEGFAWVLDEHDRYCYIDRSGTVIASGFREVNDFAEGLAAVAVKKGRFGFIDQTGEFVIQPQYSAAWRFRDGLAMVRRNGKWSYIDHGGNVVWPKTAATRS